MGAVPLASVRRIDGRLVIGAMVLVGVVFVVLNLIFASGPTGVRVLASPSSRRAAARTTYPVHLLSACAPAVDFDGSYWGPSGHWRLVRPAEPATIRLVSSDRAILHLGSGQLLRLARKGSTIRLGPCHSPSP